MFAALFSAIAAKDVLIPLASALLSAGGYHYAVRTTRKIAEGQAAEKAKEAQEASDAKVLDSFTRREVAQSDNLTQRFKLLMDGYESQITTLTAEVQTLRREVAQLRQDYNKHRMFCATCPRFKDAIADATD